MYFDWRAVFQGDTPVRPGLEKAQAKVRCSNVVLFSLYTAALYFFGNEGLARSLVPILLGYLAFCLSQIILTRRDPAFSLFRCCVAAVLDQFFIALLMWASGQYGAPFAFTPVVASIGYGLRYGARLAYFSAGVSLVFISLAAYYSPFWRELPLAAIGVVLGALYLPVYAAGLSARLAREKFAMETHAAQMEKVALEAQKALRQRQAELAHVARLSTMGEMASGIAHEINQPLSAILSYNQACIRMLTDDDAEKDEIVRGMHMAAQQAKRAGEIIERLRSFMRKHASATGPVDLNQVVVNAMVLIEHGLKDYQVVVETKLAPNLPLVSAESIQLEQVLLNLVRNGMDAMRSLPYSDRILRVSTAIVDGAVSVSVSDNGDGIPDDVLPRLFHPFYTTKKDGMGLGLVISQSIVETFGGNITAMNCPNRGALFQFSLPCLAEVTSE